MILQKICATLWFDSKTTMTNLLHHKKFLWDASTHSSFYKLKTAMSTTPVLAFPDLSKKFVVETNACEIGIGAVLSQDGYPIAYFSKELRANNHKFSTYEKEFLAFMMAVVK
jgi:hypothetical protein